MTTLSAAWSRLEQDQEAADDRYQRELKAHPLEMFEVEAWIHAFSESDYECLQYLIQQSPVSVLYALCVFSECHIPVNVDYIDREAAQRTVRQLIESWISTEQEALQALAIERIFP